MNSVGGGGGAGSLPMPVATETTEGGVVGAAKAAVRTVRTVVRVIKIIPQVSKPKPEVSKPTQKQDVATTNITMQQQDALIIETPTQVQDVPVPDMPTPVQDTSDHETLTQVQDVPSDYSTPLQQQDAPQVEQPVGKQDAPVVVTAGASEVHPNGKFENADYHGKTDNAVKSKAPQDGQAALDNSVPISPETTTRRVGVSNGEIVVLDETSSGVFHGHVRQWGDLNPKMQSALRKAGLVNKKGRIIGGK